MLIGDGKMMLKPSRRARAAKMKLDFLSSQLKEFETPSRFANSAKRHKASPAAKKKAKEGLVNFKAYRDKLRKLAEV